MNGVWYQVPSIGRHASERRGYIARRAASESISVSHLFPRVAESYFRLTRRKRSRGDAEKVGEIETGFTGLTRLSVVVSHIQSLNIPLTSKNSWSSFSHAEPQSPQSFMGSMRLHIGLCALVAKQGEGQIVVECSKRKTA